MIFSFSSQEADISSDLSYRVSRKIVQLLRPDDIHAEVEIVYQTLDGLHAACPNHPGDWYFTGRYPTPGGVRLCNEAFIAYVDRSGILNGATDMPRQ